MSQHLRLTVALAVATALAVGAGFAIGLGVPDGTAGEQGATSLDASTTPSDGAAAGSGPAGGTEQAPRSAGPVERGAGTRSSTPGPSGLDTPAPAPIPAKADLPEQTVTAQGRLVRGYPRRLLPAAPPTDVVSSSVSPSTGHVQVALVARRAGGAAAVLRFYRRVLGGSGFVERPAVSVPGSTGMAFTRGESSVVVTVDGDDSPSYSLFATLDLGRA